MEAEGPRGLMEAEMGVPGALWVRRRGSPGLYGCGDRGPQGLMGAEMGVPGTRWVRRRVSPGLDGGGDGVPGMQCGCVEMGGISGSGGLFRWSSRESSVGVWR